MKVFVSGPAADDTGVLCGGWTYIWQGLTDQDVGSEFCDCNTILEALEEAADSIGFEIVTDPSQIGECDVNILCIGEYPYAEWYGDTYDLSITGDCALDGNLEAIEQAEEAGIPTVTLIVAGRNVIIDEYLDQWDSCIMCYLPGSEGGNAVADVLTGQVEMTGTLAMPYYSSVDQIGTGACWQDIGWSALQ
ncbi:MAG: glycoside hydrolase family 3 C-terminal domain-containing protein, partial [Clostridiales bacterium]|nr:glycoside hydrolase family 3 C-terminal domain-containing protein [Clostridiales bacterium]